MRDTEFSARVDELLDEVLAQDDGARMRFLRSLEETEPRVARELAALLRHVSEAETFLSMPACQSRDRMLDRALELNTAEPVSGPDREGQILGAFRLEREIARTRRSAIYLARRTDNEWDQQVAVKVLTRGVDSDDVLRRFLAERQILSVLHHPNIAVLLDGGITPDGFPYFVMEYIEGDPVTDYCAAHRLTLRARIDLCRQVCRVVAFAHRHLVVHRDLKPSNILVTSNGQVKLLDFGIAKLLDTAIDPAISPQTIDDVRPMTPRYASPEQFSGDAISSSTDVYQLGLLFTEVLAGVADAKAALGITAAHDPEVLPSRVQGAGAKDLPYARRQLRGDLDWILLKALAPNPERRYASAAALGMDLDNHLQSRAVSARKATTPYLLRKFIRRRPVWSATIALTALGALAFIGMLSHFNRELAEEQQSALEAAARAKEVKELLVGFIQSPDPFTGSGADARVSEVLLYSEALVAEELTGRPALQMELYGTLADVYQNLALHERSVAMREEELRLRQATTAPDSFDVLQSRRKLAQSRVALGQTEQALASLQAVRSELARRFEKRLRERAIVDREIGDYYRVYGRSAESLPYLENAVRMAEQDDHSSPLLADTQLALSLAFQALRRYAEVQELLVAASRLYVAELGPVHIKTLVAEARIASNLTNMGRFEDSIDTYDEVIPEMERQLGPLHEEVLDILNNLALSYLLAGHLERSVEINREVLDRRRKKFGETHRAVADSLQNLGAVLRRLYRYDEAIEALQEASRIYREVNRPGQPLTAYPNVSLAIIHAETGAVELQEREARAALELLSGNVDKSDPALLRSQCLLGDALVRRGSLDAGLELLERSIHGLAEQSDRFARHLEACRDALARAHLRAVKTPN